MRTLRLASWIGLAGLLMSPAPFHPPDHMHAADLANLPRDG